MVARTAVVLCVSLSTLLAGVSSASATTGRSSATRPQSAAHAAAVSGVRVVISSLPAGLSPKIVVTGAHGIRRTVKRGGLLKLPPGHYVISAGEVLGASGTYYATVPRLRERVRSHHVATAKVSYATLVPKNTHVVAVSGTVALSGSPEGQRLLTLTGAAAVSASAGQFLASGPSSAAPEGYLVKVLSVEHNGETASAQVQNATLLEAVPSGEISAQQALEPVAEASSNARAARRGHREFWARAAGLSCKPTHELNVPKPSFSVKPSLDLQLKWGLFPPHIEGGTLTANLNEKLSMDASASGGAECTTTSPGIALIKPHPIDLDNVVVFVGPVPVVIKPELQLYLYGHASISASLHASLAQEANATVGVTYENGSFTPIKSFSDHFKPSLTVEGNAEAEIALRPTLEMLVYGITGPTFDIGVAAKVHANTTANPWWTVKGCLQAGVGVVFRPLDWEWSRPHLFETCKTLLHANGPFSTPTPGGSGSGSGSAGGGGAGGGGTGGKGGGGLCKRYETKGFETKCVEK